VVEEVCCCDDACSEESESVEATWKHSEKLVVETKGDLVGMHLTSSLLLVLLLLLLLLLSLLFDEECVEGKNKVKWIDSNSSFVFVVLVVVVVVVALVVMI